jgi:hypothetical protein
MRGLIAVLIVACLPLSARAQEQQPFVRTRLDPAGPVTVGQRVELSIDVFVPTWFTSPPQLPPLDVSGAFATPLPNTQHVTDVVGGATWNAVRFFYAITPQTAASITVPPIPLTFRYAIDAQPSDPITVTTRPLTFTARVPPGAENLEYFFAAPALHMTERYDPRPPAHMTVGQAFTRRIVMSATDVNALTLPPLPPQDVNGLRVTADAPEIATASEDASTRVTRTSRITYIAERPGTYTLPAVEVSYWSTSANAVRTLTLPAVTFDVAKAPAFAEEIALPPEPAAVQPPPSRWAAVWRVVRTWWWPAVIALLAIALAAWSTRRFGPPLLARVRASRARRLESEEHYFSLVERAAHTGDLRATHAAALAWLARLPRSASTITLQAAAAATNDAALCGRMNAVGAALYGRHASEPSGDAARTLARDLATIRQALLQTPSFPASAPHALVPLNPE